MKWSARARRRVLPATLASALLQPAGAASQPAPAASQASVPAGRSVSDMVAQLAATESRERLPPQHRWDDLAQRRVQMESDFEAIALHSAPSGVLVDTLRISHQARTLSGHVSEIVRDLNGLARRLEHDGDALEQDAAQWRDSLPLLRASQVPALVIDRAQAAERQLQAAIVRVREARNVALLALVRALTLQGRIVSTSALIAAQMDEVRGRRERLESAAIWQLDVDPAHLARVAQEIRTHMQLLHGNLAREGARLALYFAAIVVLGSCLYTRCTPRDAGPAQRAYGSPLAAPLVIARMAM